MCMCTYIIYTYIKLYKRMTYTYYVVNMCKSSSAFSKHWPLRKSSCHCIFGEEEWDSNSNAPAAPKIWPPCWRRRSEASNRTSRGVECWNSKRLLNRSIWLSVCVSWCVVGLPRDSKKSAHCVHSVSVHRYFSCLHWCSQGVDEV